MDQDNSNNAEDNLVFLCLDHHDQYDSRTSQSKGITAGELVRYREMLYRAVSTGLSAMTRLEAELAESRARERERDAAVISHDAAVFSQADAILSERALLHFLDDLQTNDAYWGSAMRAVDRFRDFFRESGNHYIVNAVIDPTKELLAVLTELTVFTARHFFVFPKPSSVEEDWRYTMYPELNVDRAGSGDPEDMARYDECQQALDEVCDRARDAYKAYRKAIRTTLLR